MIINPHYPCVWNEDVDQRHVAIMFYAGDTMARACSQVLTECAKLLDDHYGTKDHLVVAREKAHEHLRMKINWQ